MMPKYYSEETNKAASRVFSALIVSAHKAIRDGSSVRSSKLTAMAADLEREFDISDEEFK